MFQEVRVALGINLVTGPDDAEIIPYVELKAKSLYMPAYRISFGVLPEVSVTLS